jgi:hypothetical protein
MCVEEVGNLSVRPNIGLVSKPPLSIFVDFQSGEGGSRGALSPVSKGRCE